MPLRSSLLQQILKSAGLRLVSVLAMFAITVLIARNATTEQFGQYSFYLSLYFILLIPVAGGLPQLLVREVASLSKAQKLDQLLSLMRGVRRYNLLLLVTIVCGLVAALAWCNAGEVSPYLVLLAATPAYLAMAASGAYMRGRGEVFIGQLPEFLIRPVVHLICVGMYLLLVDQVHLLSLLLTAAASYWIAGILSWVMAEKYDYSDLKRLHNYVDVSWKPLLNSLWPLTLVAGVQVLNAQIGILFLGGMASEESVALFKVAQTLTNPLNILLSVFALVMQPRFAAHFAAKDMHALQRQFAWVALAAFALVIPVVSAFILFPDVFLVTIFGADYASAEGTLVMLSIAGLVNCSMGCVGVLLNMTGYEKESLKGVVLSLLVNIGACYLLVPPLGVYGAAIAFLFNIVMWNVYLAYVAYSKLGVLPSFLGMFCAKGN